MKRIPLYILVLLLPLLASGASNRSGIPDRRIERDAQEDSRPTGFLQIFTATETRPDGDSTYAYPHTGYTIYDQNGKTVKYIPNHLGRMDEVPTVVSIPAGQYKIRADAEHYDRVTFPVEIMPGRTSVVHLEKDSKRPETPLQDSQLIRLPDGQVVGWREPV
jgi:hypothetical protein